VQCHPKNWLKKLKVRLDNADIKMYTEKHKFWRKSMEKDIWESIPCFVKDYYKFMEKYSSRDREKFYDYLLDWSLLREYYYMPSKWDISYKDDNWTIQKLQKNDSRVPDKIKFSRMSSPEFKGFNRKIFNVSGVNATSADIQISSGCSSKSCSFSVRRGTFIETENGLQRIESVVGESLKVFGLQLEDTSGVVRQKDENVFRVTTELGNYLDCSKFHKWFILEGNNALVERETRQLKVDDTVLVRKGQSVFGNSSLLTTTSARILGFMNGLMWESKSYRRTSEIFLSFYEYSYIRDYIFPYNVSNVEFPFRLFYDGDEYFLNVDYFIDSFPISTFVEERVFEELYVSPREIINIYIDAVMGLGRVEFRPYFRGEQISLDIQRLLLMLGSESRVKSDMLIMSRVYSSFGNEGFDRDFVRAEIRRIEDLNIVDSMYDVMETSSHACVYSQILTHNCLDGESLVPTTISVKKII
jgi:hypothetical protein